MLRLLEVPTRCITALYLVIFVHVHRIHSQVWVLCSELSQKYFVSFVLSLCPLTKLMLTLYNKVTQHSGLDNLFIVSKSCIWKCEL